MTQILNETSTLAEVFEDKKFLELLLHRLEEYKHQQVVAKRNLKSGQRLRRSAWTALYEECALKPAVLVQEFTKIMNKSSSRPLRERDWIQTVITSVVFETVNYYTELKKKQPAVIEPVKVKPARKPRTKKVPEISEIQSDKI